MSIQLQQPPAAVLAAADRGRSPKRRETCWQTGPLPARHIGPLTLTARLRDALVDTTAARIGSGYSVGSQPGAVDTFTRPHMTPVTHVVYAVHYSVHELETSSMPELSRCPWLPTHNLAYVAFEVLPGHAHSGWQRCETWEIAGA